MPCRIDPLSPYQNGTMDRRYRAEILRHFICVKLEVGFNTAMSPGNREADAEPLKIWHACHYDYIRVVSCNRWLRDRTGADTSEKREWKESREAFNRLFDEQLALLASGKEIMPPWILFPDRTRSPPCDISILTSHTQNLHVLHSFSPDGRSLRSGTGLRPGVCLLAVQSTEPSKPASAC